MNQQTINKLIHDFIVHPLRHYMPANVWQPLHDWHRGETFKNYWPKPKCVHCGDNRKDLKWCKHCTPEQSAPQPAQNEEAAPAVAVPEEWRGFVTEMAKPNEGFHIPIPAMDCQCYIGCTMRKARALLQSAPQSANHTVEPGGCAPAVLVSVDEFRTNAKDSGV